MSNIHQSERLVRLTLDISFLVLGYLFCLPNEAFAQSNWYGQFWGNSTAAIPDGSKVPPQISTQGKTGGKGFVIESTVDRIARFTGTAGQIDDSAIAQSGVNIGIGTTTPDKLFVVQGAIPSLLGALSTIRTTGSNNGFGLLMDANGTGNNALGLAVNGAQKAGFAWDNSRAFLGLVNYSYSSNDFSLRINSNGSLTYHDGITSSERFRITAAGNVGIGTTTPSVKLDVAGDFNVSGNVVVAGNIAAKYQDVAEWVPARYAIPAGTVVVLDAEQSNHVLASFRAYDTRIAGVVSAKPGVILGDAGEGKVMVATTGRVRVRVDATNAPIRVGDLLVTSDREGIAMRSQPLDLGGTPIHRPGTLIGKALEPLDKGTGEILVLLSLQ